MSKSNAVAKVIVGKEEVTPCMRVLQPRMIPIEKIQAVSFNPDVRESPEALAHLRASIVSEGVGSALHAVPHGQGFVLADGHRRRLIAKELGYTELSVTVWPDKTLKDIAHLWAMLNSRVRRISGLEWMAAWHGAKVSEHRFGDMSNEMPKQVYVNIQDCLKALNGMSGIEWLVAKKVSPGVALTMHSVNALFTRANWRPNEKLPSPGNIIRWLVTYGCQNSMRQVCNLPHVKRAVINTIRKAILKQQQLNLLSLKF
jgi:hypothetical protein